MDWYYEKVKYKSSPVILILLTGASENCFDRITAAFSQERVYPSTNPSGQASWSRGKPLSYIDSLQVFRSSLIIIAILLLAAFIVPLGAS